MSIITRVGDEGMTVAGNGQRVSKDAPRIEACGAVDELMAALGLARAAVTARAARDALRALQEDVLRLGAEASGLLSGKDSPPEKRLDRKRLEALERECVRFEHRLKPPRGFVIPGDSWAAALVEQARVASRRCERRLVALDRNGERIDPVALAWINRVSDYLWLLARWLERNEEGGFPRYPLLTRT